MEIFETMVKLWFGENAQKLDRRALFTAVWEGDAERLTEEMSKMLRQSISYHDYKEDFYHAFLQVFLRELVILLNLIENMVRDVVI